MPDTAAEKARAAAGLLVPAAEATGIIRRLRQSGWRPRDIACHTGISVRQLGEIFSGRVVRVQPGTLGALREMEPLDPDVGIQLRFRFPADPILAIIDGRSEHGGSRFFAGIEVNAGRMRREGLSVYSADMWAVRLGYHPAEIWGNIWWETAA